MARRRTAIAGTATLIASTVIALAAGAAAAAPRDPSGVSHAARGSSASKLYGWIQVSNHDAKSVSAIGLHRFIASDQLQPVWTGDASGNDTLDTRVLSGKGKPISAPIQVANWSAVNDFPQVVSLNGDRTISFSGLRTTDTSDPYQVGTGYLFTSSDGVTWTLSPYADTDDNGTYGSYGSDTAVPTTGDPTPITVYTNRTDHAVSYHIGTGPLTSPAANDDPTTTATGGNGDVYFAGVGLDQLNENPWAAWYSSGGTQTTQGVFAQQIGTLGPLFHAPKSASKSPTGGYASTGDNQRIDIAQRSAAFGGGLYAGYTSGYPQAKKAILWHLGGSIVAAEKGEDIQLVDTAVGNDGKVWLIWYDKGNGSGTTLYAARSNSDVTQLGATCSATLPHKSTGVNSMAGDGQDGPLQVFLNVGSGGTATIYDRTIKPCLTVAAARHGSRVTVGVLDAGAPVQGAVVSTHKVHGTTGADGEATLQLPSSAHHHGRVSVHATGYQKAVTSF